MKSIVATALAVLSLAAPAQAREYFVGGPVREHGMEIVANYVLGIDVAPTPHGMPTGTDVIHLEADVHATSDNPYGYPDGAWIAYLTIGYAIKKDGTPWHAQGVLRPMQSNDGSDYGDNIKMDGPGKYSVVYTFNPPATNGMLRHTDKETGVPAWWTPFTQSFSFDYPVK